MKYIPSKIANWIDTGKEPEYESLSVDEFMREFDFATRYLSRLLKVRPFVMYLLLFKKAYFEEGKRKITIKLSELGENLLSDLGQPMSHDVVKRGINDLIRLNVVNKTPSRPGQINEYEVRLPSEIREVKEMITADLSTDEEQKDDRFDDYYTDPQKRLEVLKRDDYKCFYCLRELQRETFYLDHLHPRSQGGEHYKCNLVSSCKSCNTKKNASDASEFLRDNYRKELLTQNEFTEQKRKLTHVLEEYSSLKEK